MRDSPLSVPRPRFWSTGGGGLGGTFDLVTLAEFNWLMDIHFRAVVTITRHMLLVLRQQQGSHLGDQDPHRQQCPDRLWCSPGRAERGRDTFSGFLTTTRDRTATEAILAGIERRRARVLIGSSAKLPDPMSSTALLRRTAWRS